MKGGGLNKSQAVGNDPVKLAQAWFKEIKAETNSGGPSLPKASSVDETAARKAVGFKGGFAGMSRFGDKAPDFSLEGRIASRIGDGVPNEAECHFLALAAEKLPFEKFVSVMERLVERGAGIVSHYRFRSLLDRDGNLAVNQALRQANDNIAYRSVDFDIDGMSDEEFWARIDGSAYGDVIKRNAVVGMLGMAEKLGIIEDMEA